MPKETGNGVVLRKTERKRDRERESKREGESHSRCELSRIKGSLCTPRHPNDDVMNKLVDF